MRNSFVARAVAILWGIAFTCAAPHRGLSAQDRGVAVDLKPGQELTFPAAIAIGRVSLGAVRLSKTGAAHPNDGEIAVSVVKHGLSPYAEVLVTEKTSAPVDFVATGLIGDIKIDEVVICGRLDGPATNRIASGSWRVSLSRFTVRQGGQDAPAAGSEGGLPCPK